MHIYYSYLCKFVNLKFELFIRLYCIEERVKGQFPACGGMFHMNRSYNNNAPSPFVPPTDFATLNLPLGYEPFGTYWGYELSGTYQGERKRFTQSEDCGYQIKT